MKMVVLLRGINVGGNRKVPMAELRSVASDLGLTQVETYINSGNLVFDAGKLSAAQVTARLEKAILKHFGFPVDLVVRTARQWKAYAAGGPFSAAAKDRPHLLMLGLSKSRVAVGAGKMLGERAARNEHIKIVKDAIWIDFGGGVAKSKLTPAVLDRAAGSPVTLRNWRTVVTLAEMLAE